MNTDKYHITVKNFAHAPCPVGDHFFKGWEQAVKAGKMPKEFATIDVAYVRCLSLTSQGIEVRKGESIIFTLNHKEALDLSTLEKYFIQKLNLRIR